MQYLEKQKNHRHDTDMEIYEELLKLKNEGRSSALATIVQCTGSSPQKEGSKMLVRDDGSIMGTLGGGCIEAEVIAEAKMSMTDGMPRTVPFDLTEARGGLVCGGKLLVFIDPVVPGPRLVILRSRACRQSTCDCSEVFGIPCDCCR